MQGGLGRGEKKKKRLSAGGDSRAPEFWGRGTERTPVLSGVRNGLKPIYCCLLDFMEGRRALGLVPGPNYLP